jgi:hypothetical protein
VSSFERIVQLTVKAMGQESRLRTLVKDLKPNQLNTLITLIQCGGIAHNQEVIQELLSSYGGRERDWVQALIGLGKLGLVARSGTELEQFFYIVPEPLLPLLEHSLQKELTLPTFNHDEIDVEDDRTLQAPFDFSLVSLASYLHQHPARLTQQHDLHKQDREELNTFFSQLWSSENELFDFCLHFLLTHGMLSFKGLELSINPKIIDEWLSMAPADQTSLVLTKLDEDFTLAEWLIWVVDQAKGEWLPAHPLQSLYRRWILGDRWRQRFYDENWTSDPHAKDIPSFSTLLRFGFLEKGTWGQEQFYRLTEQAKSLIRTKRKDKLDKFYLTPNFEIVAPMGTSAHLLFKLGELSEFTNCDRANTYKITVQSIERAKESGWKREEVLRFFDRYSQLGIPENVDFTLKKWLGKQPVAEFHNVLLLTVNRNYIQQFESNNAFKPFIVHRFFPGMYAVHPEKKVQLEDEMRKNQIEFGDHILEYPQGNDVHGEKNLLAQQVVEAKELQLSLEELSSPPDINPQELCFITEVKTRKDTQKPRFSRMTCKQICEQAISQSKQLRMLYSAKNQDPQWIEVTPERLTESPNGKWVLVGQTDSVRHSLNFALHKITELHIL